MFLVTARNAGMKVELVCSLCQQPLTLETGWLAFPGDALKAEARWLHRECLRGNVAAVFGTAAVTLLAGVEAFKRLAETFEQRRQAIATLE